MNIIRLQKQPGCHVYKPGHFLFKREMGQVKKKNVDTSIKISDNFEY